MNSRAGVRAGGYSHGVDFSLIVNFQYSLVKLLPTYYLMNIENRIFVISWEFIRCEDAE